MRPASGFRLLPHTADVMISAWAPTVEGCLAQSVRGLVSCFADVAQLRPKHMVAFACAPASESELLVELLDEAIYVVDAQDVVPVQVGVARTEDGGLVGEFGVVARADVTVVGPVPKAATRHALGFEQDDSIWRCQVVVDV